MPPRKSVDASKPATGDEGTGTGTPAKEGFAKEGVNIEDLNLPKSIVTRLAKGVLPANTQIQGNAMLAMTKSATVFVSYLATHANEHTQSASRKTIAPQDVLAALDDLEFPEFKPRLEAELARFVELQTDKRNTYRKKVAADKASGKAGSPAPGEEEAFVEDEHEHEGGGVRLDRDGQPVAKRARVDGGAGVREDGMRDGRREEDGDNDNDEAEEDEGDGEEEPDDEEEEADEIEERQEAEDQNEEQQQHHDDDEDEALDNGEDSD